MNGDTIEYIARFMEREEDGLPPRVSNSMLLIALREERAARQRDMAAVLEKVAALVTVLEGREPDGSDGLLHQIGQFNHFRRVVVWVFSAVALAFLSGVGMWAFAALARGS